MSGGGRRTGPGVSPARNGGSWIRSERRWAIYERDDFTCLYCGHRGLHHTLLGRPFVLKMTLDHYHGHSNCSSNLSTCCHSCNSSKRNLTPRQWYALLRKRLCINVMECRKIQARIRRQLKKPVKQGKIRGRSILEMTK